MTMIKDGKGKGRSYAGAMKAKKNRDLARGFGAGRDGMLRPGTYEVSISELKKRTKCNKCGQLGHWARECPSKTKKPLGSSSSESGRSNSTKSKEVNYLAQDVVPESEFFFLTSEPIEEGNEGEGVADFYDDRRYAGHSDDCLWLSRDYMERPQPHPCFHVDTCFDLACATIDTGCQRMAIGLNTLSSIMQTQPPELPVTYHDELHQFRSVHQVSCTHRLACIPCSLGPKGCILRPALFEESSSADAPFLLSLPFLLHCRATLILDEQQGLSLMSRKFGFKVRCFLGPTGALRIPIQQFTGEMIQALSQQVSSDSREYELLRTEHCDSNVSGDPRTLASTGRSQVREPTPFPGAVSRDISLSNDGRPFEARQNRIYVTTQGDPSMESHGSTSNVDHHPSNRPSGDYVPEHMVGPQGVLARQMIESGELLDAQQLDVVVTRLGQRLQEQSVRESKEPTSSPTPSSWSRVTSTQAPAQQAVPPMPRTPKTNPPSSMPATPDRYLASMWEVPAGINLQKDSPQCYCHKNALLFVSKTEKNPNRLFWKCPNPRNRQCSFFRWLAQETIRPDLLPVGTPESTVEWMLKRQQEVCQHIRTTRSGSNAFYRRTRCLDCGTLLEKESAGYQPQRAESEQKSEAAGSSKEAKIPLMQNMEKEYEEFLAWRNQRTGEAMNTDPPAEEAAASSAKPRPSRSSLFW